jgi:hypothetical protein
MPPSVQPNTRQNRRTIGGVRSAALMKRRRSAALRYFRAPVGPYKRGHADTSLPRAKQNGRFRFMSAAFQVRLCMPVCGREKAWFAQAFVFARYISPAERTPPPPAQYVTIEQLNQYLTGILTSAASTACRTCTWRTDDLQAAQRSEVEPPYCGR